ncbi:hypothetical protein K469DRAFT_752468 [Zopfia rhizophila CBS 207.26]|uniref:Uncharacterized protein n=1 Tax=Zopfia rhizophila CBS 207.26 TaxID=1314779 RepID=A0A6A6DWG7_9PEZI|nr:hypothetical protein K469DRAFT_752468 [Zopfia rhizophila CBS 207.26]
MSWPFLGILGCPTANSRRDGYEYEMEPPAPSVHPDIFLAAEPCAREVRSAMGRVRVMRLDYQTQQQRVVAHSSRAASMNSRFSGVPASTPNTPGFSQENSKAFLPARENGGALCEMLRQHSRTMLHIHLVQVLRCNAMHGKRRVPLSACPTSSISHQIVQDSTARLPEGTANDDKGQQSRKQDFAPPEIVRLAGRSHESEQRSPQSCAPGCAAVQVSEMPLPVWRSEPLSAPDALGLVS